MKCNGLLYFLPRKRNYSVYKEVKSMKNDSMLTQEKQIKETHEEVNAELMLKDSIELARKCGVPEDKILHNIAEIDEFFTK